MCDRRRVSETEHFLRSFHARHAGATSAVFARTGSYARLAAAIGSASRVLDLACGDHPLPGAIGLDLSLDELARGAGARVQGRAQALPFADGAFDGCVCHLAFMLLDDLDQVVRELARVLVPGGVFAALLGGGPVEGAGERDAFHRFLAIGAPRFLPLRFGDPRARSEAGWRALFTERGWSVPVFERVELDLGGAFEDVWAFLGASYQLPVDHAPAVRAELHAALGDRVDCRVAAYLAAVRR